MSEYQRLECTECDYPVTIDVDDSPPRDCPRCKAWRGIQPVKDVEMVESFRASAKSEKASAEGEM